MLLDFLRKICAIKIVCKFYNDYSIVTIYGLFNRVSAVINSPLRKYLVESTSPSIISWYSQKYTFILPTKIATDLNLVNVGLPLGFLTYDKVCIDESAFKNASLKLYNIINSLSIESMLYALYFSLNTSIVVLDVNNSDVEHIKTKIRNSYKNIEIKGDKGYLYLYIPIDERLPKVHLETPKIIIDPEINKKLIFIMSYRLEHNLMKNTHIQVAYDEIVNFCKNNNKSLSKPDIRERLLKVLDDLYETCQKEVDTKESLEMLKLQAELDGIELFLNNRN